MPANATKTPTDEYRTFTATVQTPTQLDQFAPQAIDELARRFEPVEQLQVRVCDTIDRYAREIEAHEAYADVARNLDGANERIREIFRDFRSRMDYFTLVFFGAVNAGKTSTLCDLAGLSPHDLNRIISRQDGFRAGDGVEIGPNVATKHLYEILIPTSRLRLVDVPGISGVVHDNDSLAPFVNLADCVVFLMSSSSDITRDDADFLYEHVAAIDRRVSGERRAGFASESPAEKKLLIVLNKWDTTYRVYPPQAAEAEFERKKKWILFGDANGQGRYRGVAGFFHKPPEVVRANSRIRDEAGVPYPNQDDSIGTTEIVAALKAILEETGVEYRLHRPLEVLARETTRLAEAAAEEAADRRLDHIARGLKQVDARAAATATQLRTQIAGQLNSLQQHLALLLGSRMKAGIRNWKPSVGLLEGLKGIVPDLGIFNRMNLGKSALSKDLQERWKKELGDLIQVDQGEMQQILERELQGIQDSIRASFDLVLQESEALSGRAATFQPGSAARGGAAKSIQDELAKQIAEVAEKIKMGVFDDVVGLIQWDVILALLLGAILTPAGSALLIAYRRWRRGQSKGQEAKQEIERVIDEVALTVASDIRSRVHALLDDGISRLQQEVAAMVGAEAGKVERPLQLLTAMAAELRQSRKEVDALQAEVMG